MELKELTKVEKVIVCMRKAESGKRAIKELERLGEERGIDPWGEESEDGYQMDEIKAHLQGILSNCEEILGCHINAGIDDFKNQDFHGWFRKTMIEEIFELNEEEKEKLILLENGFEYKAPY